MIITSITNKVHPLSVLLLATVAVTSSANVLSFHDVLTSGSSGVNINNGATVVNITASRIYGDDYSEAFADPTNSISSLESGHGNNPANQYTDGGLFEPAGDVGLRSNSTRLEGLNRLIADGDASNMANFVGFHLHFDVAVPLFDFYMMDLDGGEFSLAFALNGTNAITPTITTGDTSQLSIKSNHALDTNAYTTAINNLTSGVDSSFVLPTTIDVAVDDPLSGNVRGTDPAGQIKFSFDGAEGTDVFFAWGKWDNNTNDNSQRSGLSGFSVIESAAPVPEPSSTTLIGLGTLALSIRRKR